MPRLTTPDMFYDRVRARHGNSIVLGTYTKAKARIDARCVKCGHKWQPVAQWLYENGCYPCNKHKFPPNKSNTFTYKFQLWKKYGERVRLRGSYVAAMTPAEHYCRVHNQTFMVRPQGMLRGNMQCCTKHAIVQRGLSKRTTEAEVRRRIAEKHSGAIQLIGKYTLQLDRHTFRCDQGHEWQTTPDAVMRLSGCPTCNGGHGYSRAAINWLERIAARLGRPLQHAENGGEKIIEAGGRRWRVDGFDPKTGTVYEFHGDAFHGNPAVFGLRSRPNPYRPDATAASLYKRTKEKEHDIQAAGHCVVALWETDWHAGKLQSYRLGR